jgi:glycine/D-amino acid oxidase-like deaminating enzyme
MQTQVAEMLGVNLPVFSELHQKVAFKDSLEVVARHAPLLVWTDPQSLYWSAEERQMLAEEPEFASLLGTMPAGVHTRPEGGEGSQMVLMLWEYHTQRIQPSWPLPLDDQYAEIVLRGLVPMLPGLKMYLDKFPQPRHDGGYYTKTRENRPLIGPLPVSGAYLIGALSGFGLMAACAAGELIAAYISKGDLPDYAPVFRLERYSDAHYLKLFEQLDSSGQL